MDWMDWYNELIDNYDDNNYNDFNNNNFDDDDRHSPGRLPIAKEKKRPSKAISNGYTWHLNINALLCIMSWIQIWQFFVLFHAPVKGDSVGMSRRSDSLTETDRITAARGNKVNECENCEKSTDSLVSSSNRLFCCKMRGFKPSPLQ